MAWTIAVASQTIRDMTGEPKKVRENVLSVALKGPALEALKLLLARFPGRDNKSQVYRKIVDVGIRALAADPDLMLKATTPSPEEVRRLLAAEPGGPSMGATTFMEGMRGEAPGPDPSASALERAKKRGAAPKGVKAPDDPLTREATDAELQRARRKSGREERRR